MLARELGYASPAKMLGEMLPSELGEWLAYYALSPWGEMRADFRAAQQTVILANVNRDKAVHPKPFELQDFMFDSIVARQDESVRNEELSKRLKAELLGYSRSKR